MNRDTRRPRRTRLVWLWAGILLAIAGGSVALTAARDTDGDFGIYRRAARRMLRGEPLNRPGEVAFSYPPAMALPTIPVVLLPETWQRPAWYALNLAALLIGLRVLRRAFLPYLSSRGLGWRGEVLFWSAVLLAVAPHLTAALENQTHDPLLFFCMMVTVWGTAQNRDLVAGAAAGVATAWKATALLFLPVFVVQRRSWAVAGMVLALAAVTSLPELLWPPSKGSPWILQWCQTYGTQARPGSSPDLPGAWASWNHLNQGLAGTLYRLTALPPSDPGGGRNVRLIPLGPTARRVLIGAAQLSVLGVVGWAALAARRKSSAKVPSEDLTPIAATAAVLCGMLLLSPMSSKAHFGTLVVPVACMAAAWLRHRDAVLGSLLLAVGVLSWLTAKDLVGRPAANTLLSGGLVTWCAALCLLGAILTLSRKTRE